MKRVRPVLITRKGDAPHRGMVDNIRVGDGDIALRSRSVVLVDYVCMAKHRTDAVNADGYTVALRGQLNAYCARGADMNHEWVRVPTTPLEAITTGLMEDRPPEPAHPAIGRVRTR